MASVRLNVSILCCRKPHRVCSLSQILKAKVGLNVKVKDRKKPKPKPKKPAKRISKPPVIISDDSSPERVPIQKKADRKGPPVWNSLDVASPPDSLQAVWP